MQAILKKINTSRYFPESEDSPAMFTIAHFLCSEAGGSISWIYDFIKSLTWMASGGDAVSMEKEGENIILEPEWHRCDDLCPSTAIIQKDEFLKMLYRWEELYKQKPDEIVITQDDEGKITMVGKFVDGREI